MEKIFRVATRSSPLALRQAEMAAAFLSKKIPNSRFEILPMKTTGDKSLEWSLEARGGKGLFTKELEDALLCGRADIAVHSAKDLPVSLAEGLAVSCLLPRDDCRDVLIRKNSSDSLRLISTASPRRRAQLKKLFPEAEFTQIRGNVGTRLKKILEGEADATMLSAAGLDRLGIAAYEGLGFERLSLDKCVPAAAQGIIAVQTRTADAEFFGKFSDAKAELAASLERGFLSALGGGCQTPFGANFDGEFFRVYHEKTGFLKFDFSGFSEEDKMLAAAKNCAKKILDM
ncbi:MAG: hydroxymethylbilane synthase [Opitutales bacterium]|nr:hydroxymethylbilane synthase [Opitutales bacterium]